MAHLPCARQDARNTKIHTCSLLSKNLLQEQISKEAVAEQKGKYWRWCCETTARTPNLWGGRKSPGGASSGPSTVSIIQWFPGNISSAVSKLRWDPGFFSLFFFFLTFCPRHIASGIFVPWPAIEPMPPALEARSLSHWVAREVPVRLSLCTSVCTVHGPVRAEVPIRHSGHST